MLDTCRLCGGNDLKLWMHDGRDRNLDYYKCGNCALWNYDLDCGLDQSQYTEIYVSPQDTENRSNVAISQSWSFLRKYTDTPGSIMDIGCASAYLLHLARKEGWQVRGMDLTQKTADEVYEDQGIEIVVANFLEYDNPDNELYDVVVLRHVLEHLPDSILAMSKIGGLLKDNGYALLEFPNTQSLSYKVKRILKNAGLRNKKYSASWRPGHCNEFCRKSFEYLLARTGFELVVWRTYSSKPITDAICRYIPIASKVRAVVRKKPNSGDLN